MAQSIRYGEDWPAKRVARIATRRMQAAQAVNDTNAAPAATGPVTTAADDDSASASVFSTEFSTETQAHGGRMLVFCCLTCRPHPAISYPVPFFHFNGHTPIISIK